MTQQVSKRILILSVAISVLAEAVLGRVVISADDLGSKLDNNTELRLQRIVNGKLAKEGSHPYMAFIEEDNEVICGGTLIHPKWVLTAAHCLYEYNRRTNQQGIQLTVTLGSLQVKSTTARDPFREVIGVSQIIIHEAFVNDEESVFHHLQNDIALLRLSTPSHMDPADKLADATEYLIEDKKDACVMAGWGDTRLNQIGDTNDLREVYVTLMSNDRCERFQASDGAMWTGLIDGQVCAYSGRNSDERPGGCDGDSGGPLMCGYGRGGRNVLYGVISFGDENCIGNMPTVFTRVSHYKQWIKRKCNNCVH